MTSTMRDPATIDLFIGVAEIVPCRAKGKRNPCVHWFGPGPEGSACRTCRNLEAHGGGSQRTWYKCALRAPGGPATDHRVNWPACAQYKPDFEKG